MANPTGGFGLRPVRRLDGAAPTFQLREVEIAYNYSGVIAKGDIVKWLNTGLIDLYAAAGAQVGGVFMGCKYRDPNIGNMVWRPMWNAVSGLASTEKVIAYILDDPMMVYEVRLNGTTVGATTHIGQTLEVIVGTPSALNGQSVMLGVSSGLGTTTTLPLRVVGLGQGADNDNTVKNNIIEVVLNTLTPGYIAPANTL
jgi:hypothetical protein